jgi:hypothetical protein
MSNVETRFLTAIDSYTHALPDYDRGVASVFALAAFRTGYRYAKDEQDGKDNTTTTK